MDTEPVPAEDVITTEVLVEVLSQPKQSVQTQDVHIRYVLLEFTDVALENVLDVMDVHHMLMDITWVTSVQLVVVEEKLIPIGPTSAIQQCPVAFNLEVTIVTLEWMHIGLDSVVTGTAIAVHR